MRSDARSDSRWCMRTRAGYGEVPGGVRVFGRRRPMPAGNLPVVYSDLAVLKGIFLGAVGGARLPFV
jgi:hypothetical protein